MSRSASLFRRLSMALVFVFLYAPILVLIVFSFNDSSSRSVWAGFTLDWYRELLRDDLILDAFYTTLAVSVLAAVIATVAGTFAAIGFYNMKRRWRGPLMTINNIPMVNADIVQKTHQSGGQRHLHPAVRHRAHPADRHQPAGGQSGEGGQEAPPLIFAAFSRENRKP